MKLKFNKEVIKSKYLTNWKFWYKFIAGLGIILTILIDFFMGMAKIGQLKDDVQNWMIINNETSIQAIFEQFNDRWGIKWIELFATFNSDNQFEKIVVSSDFGGYTINTFTYFTILSNIAVAIWFFVAAFKPQNEAKRGIISTNSSLIVGTYITITMLIYNFLLLPASAIDEMKWSDWLSGMLLHLIFPLMMIIYLVVFFKPLNVRTKKEYMTHGWWKQILVLLIYGAVILIRGEMRYQGNKPFATRYPYFFFHIHEKNVVGLPGVAWFFIAVILIAGIAMGFSILYVEILLRREKKLKANTKNIIMTTNEVEHDKTKQN